MTICRFYLDSTSVQEADANDEINVHLYGGSASTPGSVAIGNQIRDLFLRFGVQPSVRAVDLVSIGLAVTAADTFVLRDNSENGWSRDIHICLPLRNPDAWAKVSSQLSKTLAFLSGDTWTFEFLTGGQEPPTKSTIASHHRWVDLQAGDLVSLFSGGLDSTISTLQSIGQGARPILVSHAYAGDQGVQDYIVGRLPKKLQHASVNAWPNSSRPSDISMRTRSFLFISLAALVCDVKSKLLGGKKVSLRIPENGVIALNAPLTPRRIGSHSTRTTHPYYLQCIQSLFDAVGISAEVNNPYELWTKGQMVLELQDDKLFNSIASETVSCGKWKRGGVQCGRCVPCLIRRAALYAGGVDDLTQYQSQDLSVVLDAEDTRDDLVAMMTAVQRVKTDDMERWVTKAGPLPTERMRRMGLVDVYRRGLLEVRTYLSDCGLIH